MPYPEGPCEDLCITDVAPAPTTANLAPWEDFKGAQITNIHKYDPEDDTYLVSLADQTNPAWVHATWVVQRNTPENIRRAWRDSSLTEFQQQMSYAAAFQRLLWREISGNAVKRCVGDRVTIRRSARVVERAFPAAWNEDWHPTCWGKTGEIVSEHRQFGADNELHRAYKVRIEMPESVYETMTVWWTGEDLE